ncbi:MAG: alanine--glyoxylate aminotransferase family protein [Acidobacteria bacterium]|nr:alanine--glyoxylate aminotransferase family protein [Acidobacteriota bacterium]
MTDHVKLFIPGPGDVDDEVLAAMGQPVQRHYGPVWKATYGEAQTLLKQIFGTGADLFIVPGPGSAALDMAIGSLLPIGQSIIVGQNGFFGDRLTDIAEAHALNVVPLKAPIGQPLDPAALRLVCDAHPDARVVAITHHETSTTVLNPIRELAAAARAAGRVVVVDAVSSLGGVELPVDAWGIDVCVTASNKCLEGPAGLGFISVSPRAWEMVDDHPGAGHGWYLNLRTWRQYAKEWGAWHPTPVTVSSNTLLAVLTSLRAIARVGMPAHLAKYARAGRRVREGMIRMGFVPYVAESCSAPMVTAFHARPEFTVSEFSGWLLDERHIAISGGLGDLAGKIFRVGHLGRATSEEYLTEFLAAVEAFLWHRGLFPQQRGL